MKILFKNVFYAITYSDYDEYNIHGLYRKRENAEKELEKIKASCRDGYKASCYDIDEYTFQD